MIPTDPEKHGSPLAYRNLFTQKGNKEVLLLLAIWNSLEGLTCLFSDHAFPILIVGILLDIALSFLAFACITKTPLSGQKKYLAMLSAWNFLDTAFLLFPNSVTSIVVCFRALTDATVNLVIILMAYYKPQTTDFATIKDRDAAAAQAELLSDPFEVDADGGLSLPPIREVLSALQLRAKTVPEDVRIRQTPERIEAGAPPDPDIGALSYEQVQAKLNPLTAGATKNEDFAPSISQPVAPSSPVSKQPTEVRPTAAAEQKSQHKTQTRQRSIMGTPAGVNTLSEYLTDDEFVRYTAASRLITANTLWRQDPLSDTVQAEAAYEKAMELEKHCPLFKIAFDELRDLVITKRKQPNAHINFSTEALLLSVRSSYETKLGDKEM